MFSAPGVLHDNTSRSTSRTSSVTSHQSLPISGKQRDSPVLQGGRLRSDSLRDQGAPGHLYQNPHPTDMLTDSRLQRSSPSVVRKHSKASITRIDGGFVLGSSGRPPIGGINIEEPKVT